MDQETKVLKELQKMEEVQEVHLVYGTYDIIAVIKAEIVQALKDIINFRIRHLKGVNSTLTMIVVSKQSNSHFHT
jgi:DNA-binding Lrp family transcriptional regulator